MAQIVIRLADICNLECKMCEFVHSSSTYGQMMSINDFESIVNKLKSAKIHGYKIDTIRLDGNREGLLYPDIIKAVKIVKNAGFRSYLVTNGVKLNKNLVIELIKAGLNSINFSVSGITEKVYSEFQGYKRPGEQLNKVLENIRNTVNINRSMGTNGESMSVGVSMLLNETSDLSEEYRKAILYYKKIGVNGILIGSQYPKYDIKETKGSDGCLSIPIIGVDGNVTPCCGGVETIKLGNIFNDDVAEIFDGSVMHDLYDGLKRRFGKTLPKDCCQCIYNGLPSKKYRTFDLRGINDLNNYCTGYLDLLASKGKKIYVIGANDVAYDLIKICKEDGIQIEAIIDNDYMKWGNTIEKIPVIPPREAGLNQVYVGCIKTQRICDDIMKKFDGEKYLASMFLEYFTRANPVFSYSYILN